MTRLDEPLISHPDDLRALRAFRAEDATLDADARAAARVALLEQIEAASPAAAPPATRRGVPLRRPRRCLFAGLGLASGAAAAVALVLALGSGGVRPEPASAADALNRAADVAAEGQQQPLLADGQYWYMRSESFEPSRTYGAGSPQGQVTFRLADVRTRTEQWIDSAGGGRTIRQLIGEPRFATPADREAWIAAGRPSLGRDEDYRSAPGGLAGSADGTRPQRIDGWLTLVGMSYEPLRALPTDDDDALADQLARAAGDLPGRSFALGANLLRLAPLTAAQRAAIYRVLARVPGTELLGTVTDELGRTGTGIAFAHDGVRVELIFDPATAALLAVHRSGRSVSAPGMQGEDVQEALLATGVVDGPDDRP